jgi:uncharacterized MnhB-related membrane protein
MVLNALIVIGAIFCGIQAFRAQRLISAAIWLAVVSALTALLLYLMGAPEVAVIELSVGAGLVTVLMVFAISMAGEEELNLPTIVPKPLAWLLVLGAAGLLIWMALPVTAGEPVMTEITFAQRLWEQRAMDVLLQVVLIFAGMLGVLALLVTEKAPAKAHEFEIVAPVRLADAASGNGRHPTPTPAPDPEEDGATKEAFA